jgi:hypothetical protein
MSIARRKRRWISVYNNGELRHIFKAICSPSHKNAAAASVEKCRKAFINFYMQMRQRNRRYGSTLAKVFGLALYKWGVNKTEGLLCFVDNFNQYLTIKCQDGHAGEMRNFCAV